MPAKQIQKADAELELSTPSIGCCVPQSALASARPSALTSGLSDNLTSRLPCMVNSRPVFSVTWRSTYGFIIFQSNSVTNATISITRTPKIDNMALERADPDVEDAQFSANGTHGHQCEISQREAGTFSALKAPLSLNPAKFFVSERLRRERGAESQAGATSRGA